ncbi:IS1 family transposase, partial [filamentous cyanobacterium LEGE 11480]|nr:IS1 family transposase [Romeriopsis navalis LEGE 11480]
AVEIHANHCEAHNAAIRRRCSAFRRRQNLYAKTVVGLQRAITVQRLIHNWVRPHYSLNTTPAVALGFVKRPLSLQEILLSRGFHEFPT